MPTDFVTTIDILRHGQTQADEILRGRIDVPLSSIGYQQMQLRLAPFISSSTTNPVVPWQQIISSPLQRCAQFSHDLARQYSSAIDIDPGFLEMDFGDWDGRPLEELKNEDPDLFQRVWSQPHKYNPPNGESFQQFSQRIHTAWGSLLSQYSGKHILLVCHGGVIRALLAHVMQTPLTALSRIEVPYACLSRVKVYYQQDQEPWPQLVFHNHH